MFKQTVFWLSLILVVSLACGASARITYVDATDGRDPNVAANTTLASGDPFMPVDVGSGGSGADGLWRVRAFSNGGSIYESRGDFGGNNTEDCPRLKTSVEVPEGAYNVYAYMITAGNAPWRLAASLEDSEGDLPVYLCADPNGEATLTVAEDFKDPVPLLTEADRTLWQVYLGTTGTTTAVTVYIDDDATSDPANGGNARTWYDGIGYETAPPRIAYVDATEGETGNTVLATGEVFMSTDDGSGSDNLWRGRVFANDGTIFESGGQFGDTANPEDCPRLMTMVDVPEGDYSVYAYFWADGGPWRIQASLTDEAGDLPLFLANDPNGAPQAMDTDFADPVPLLAEGNRTLWQAYLGDTGTTNLITVYIDDDPNHQTHNARTWYDGIGYKPAPPKIVYVDSTDGLDPNVAANTSLATGDPFLPVDVGSAGSGSDGLWRIRAFANEGTIYESGGDFNSNSNTEDLPRLTTWVEVPEGYYDVYVYFWADGSPWRIQASLENPEGDMPLYLANDPNTEATQALASDFADPVPLLAEDNRTLWQVWLGTTGNTSTIQVYVDDDPNHLTGGARTWYDGIGYRPEE